MSMETVRLIGSMKEIVKTVAKTLQEAREEMK